MSIS
ncbi:hypothetical protein YPPY54_0978, partial [Yersinia pestis PY-54]|jgi:hypothetical protein